MLANESKYMKYMKAYIFKVSFKCSRMVLLSIRTLPPSKHTQTSAAPQFLHIYRHKFNSHHNQLYTDINSNTHLDPGKCVLRVHDGRKLSLSQPRAPFPVDHTTPHQHTYNACLIKRNEGSRGKPF